MAGGSFELSVLNQSGQKQDFVLFVQADNGSLQVPVATLAWMTKGGVPNSPVFFTWDERFAVVAGTLSNGYGPGTFSQQASCDVQVGGADLVRVSCEQGGLTLNGPHQGGGGSIVAQADASVPPGQSFAVGLAVAGRPAMACQLLPIMRYAFSSTVSYSIAAGSFEAGQVIETDQINSYRLSFDSGRMSVIYTAYDQFEQG